jgi:hypothetical protein
MLTVARVSQIVEAGFEAAGDLIQSATLERETGAASYDPATLTLTAGVISSTPCRFLEEENDSDAEDAGAVETQSTVVGYLADLSANHPKNSDRLRVGTDVYVIEDVEDSSAGTGLLFKVKIKRV